MQNGIVENFRELRAELEAEGIEFKSDTDTEVIAHLVGLYYTGDRPLTEAVRMALRQLRGPSAVVVMSHREPGVLVAARLGNAGGVAVGFGEGEMFIASDMPAILEHTRRMVFLENGQMAVVTRDGATFSTLGGQPFAPKMHIIPWDPISAAKGEYKHFMQKEIYEQANSLTDTIRGRVDLSSGEVYLEQVTLTAEWARNLTQLVGVACGTSYHSELVGAFMFEQLARLPVRVEYASEFRYRDPVIDDRTLMLAITQSGETVDTLAAMEEGRGKGAHLVSIVNVIGSQAARVSDSVIYMHTGPEIGVASTKAFTASMVDQYLLAVCLGALRGTLSQERRRDLLDSLAQLPALVGQLLDVQNHKIYEELAQAFFQHSDFLYLGRGINFPVALEGALEAQGDQLHPRRRLSRRRDEAWAHRADRRAHAGGRYRAAGSSLRQDDQPDRAGEGAGGHRHRSGKRGGRLHRDQGRPRAARARHVRAADPGVDRDPAATAGVPHGRAPRRGCGSAAESGEVSHGGVTDKSRSAAD